MQFTGPQTGSGERIVASFYLARNAALHALAVASTPGYVGKSLRGMPVCFIIVAANLEKGFGIDVQSLDGASAEERTFAAGVIYSDRILGTDPIQDTWVNVQVYGQTDRVLVSGGAATADLVALWTSSDGTNGAIGYSTANMVFERDLIGTFTFDAAPAAGETIDLSGATTLAGDWTARQPGVLTVHSATTLNPGQSGYLGITPKVAATVPANIPGGFAGARQAFLGTLGMGIITS